MKIALFAQRTVFLAVFFATSLAAAEPTPAPYVSPTPTVIDEQAAIRITRDKLNDYESEDKNFSAILDGNGWHVIVLYPKGTRAEWDTQYFVDIDRITGKVLKSFHTK